MVPCAVTACGGVVGSMDSAPGATAGADLRETEIKQLCTGLRQHHVAGLQIAVHDALPVCRGERVGNLPGNVQGFANREPGRRLRAQGFWLMPS